ncbi:MAG: hypothetical protein J1E60_06640 [Christensenellaceae bacterium]|nr:hypothetical protein [Christensenellaceae bacterium]
MRKNRRPRFFKGAFCALFIAAIMLIPSIPNSIEVDDPHPLMPEDYIAELSRLKTAYYDSSIIVIADCTRSYSAPSGANKSDFIIRNVFAGLASSDETIAVDCKSKVGEKRLMYLDKSTVVNNVQNYRIVNNCSFRIDNNNLVFNEDLNVPVDMIVTEILKQNQELQVPQFFMYYNNFASLVNGSRSVIIGRVESIGEYLDVACRSVDRGETIKRNMRIADVVVSVENALGSRYSAGTEMKIKLIEDASSYVIGSHDLAPVPKGEIEELFPGKYYIIFLLESEDKKESCFFTVNPYQGFVPIGEGNTISSSDNAMFGIETVNEFITKLDKLKGNNLESER